MNSKLRTALIVTITIVWAVNFLAPVYQHSYKPPAEINLAFMGVVGMLTAGYKNGTPPPPPPAPEPVARTPPRKKPAKRAAADKVANKKQATKAGKKVTKKQPGRKESGRR